MRQFTHAIATILFFSTFLSVSAQTLKHGTAIFYLDSGSNHYLQLDSIGTGRQTEYRVREFYRNTLLSSGKTNWLPDHNYLQTILTYTVRTYQNHWYDTILLFDFFGDTLQYSYIGDINKTFDIHYTDNRRTEYERYGKNRVSYQWVTDGIIEKHYNNKRLQKLVLRPYDSAARTLYYRPKRHLTPYYSPSEDLYFSLYTDDMTSVYPKYYAFGTKVSRKQFNVTYPSSQFNTNRTQHLYQNHPFLKRQYRRLFRNMRRHRDREQLIFSKEYTTESVTSIHHNMKGRITHYKDESLKSPESYSEQYLKSLTFKSVYRYASPNFHGHIYFKKHSFTHVDTIVRDGKTYITSGYYKNNYYHFKTYCNQSLFRHGKARLFPGNKRPKGLHQYADKGYKTSRMEEIYPYIHEHQYAETDTFFLGDTTLIFGAYKIYLRTADTEKLLIDSLHYNTNRIVKDQAQCAVGVKTLNDQWLIPPTYDHIQYFWLPGSNTLVYHASVNDYGALYNHKGQLMIPPTRGLSFKTLPLKNYYSSALDVINQLAFICNDLTTDSFKLIDQFNRVVLQGAGQYSHIHNMLGIKHQGKMTLEFLNTKQEKHWFKDTISFAGRDNVLLWETKPDANGRQLRLLNTATKQLEPDTFCFFYVRDYNWGLESNQRRIYFSNSRISFIDSQLLPIESFYNIKDFMVIKNGEKHGIIENGKVIIQPEYDAIRLGALTHAAIKDSILYLIDRHTGQILKNLGYQRLSTRMPKSVSEFPYLEINYGKNTVIEIVKDGKLGLIDHRGNEILPCIYRFLRASISFGNLKVDNIGSPIETCDQDSVFQAWQFENTRLVKSYPKQPILYNNYDKQYSYIGFSGQKFRYQYELIERKTSQINPDITTFNIHQIVDTSKIIKSRFTTWDGGRGNRKLVGILDEKLEWIMRFDTFENLQDEKTFFYFMTKDKRCGVMDKNFKPLIPARYRYISYDPEHLLLWYKDDEQAMWTLRNLSLDTVTADSLDYPVSIESGQSTAIVSRNGYYGEIYKTGFLLIPPIYERASEITHNQRIQMFYKNHTLYSKPYYSYRGLLPQPYEKLYIPSWAKNQESYELYGVKGKMLYAIRNFQAFDSSKQLFLNKSPFERELNKYQNLQQEYSSTNDIRLRKTRLCHLIENTAVEYRFWWHSPTPKLSFPEYHYLAPNNQLFKGTMNPWQGLSKDSLKSSHITGTQLLEIEDILNQQLVFVSEGFNTLSFRGKQYLHLLLDSANVYKFTLNDIIDPAKKDSLNHYLHKIWLKQENPNLACVPANQIFEMFNNSFIMSGPYFSFLPRQLDLRVRIEEMKSFMSPVWAARF